MNIIIIYISIWSILTLIWFLLLIKNRKEIILFKRDYFSFLFKGWKIILFLVALISLSYISTLGYDPSWDIPMTIIMSFLTFYTSPFVVGTIYRYLKWINKNKIELYISFILLFFSSAWFYDMYAMIILLWYYPPMAFSNLWLSPFFYLFAWIMWNLDYNKEKWVVFSYTEKEWIYFKWDKDIFNKIFIYILPIIIFMVFIFWYFIYLNI